MGSTSKAPPTLLSLFGLAGIIEFVGGLLIAAGLVGRVCGRSSPAVRWLSAYFIAHLPRGFWPIQNGGELAMLFCFVFLYIASRGAGVWSIDRALEQ